MSAIKPHVRIVAMLNLSPPDLERRVLAMIKLRAIIGLPGLTRELNLGCGGVTSGARDGSAIDRRRQSRARPFTPRRVSNSQNKNAVTSFTAFLSCSRPI